MVVPGRSVLIDGAQTSAWYTIDPTTGETIGVTQDERNQGIVEYAAAFAVSTIVSGVLFRVVNLAFSPIGINSYGTPADLKKLLQNQFNIEAGGAAVFLVVAVVFAFIPAVVILSFVALGISAGLGLNALALLHDPDLPQFLVSPLPLDALADLSGSGQLLVGVAPDPQFTIPASSGLLPPVYRIGVKNQGPSESRYKLSVGNLPAGFTGLTSVPEVDVPAGSTGEVGLVLEPSGALPPPGTTGSFTVTVTNESDPTDSTTQNVTFTVPAVDRVTLSGGTPVLTTAPGVPVTDPLTLTKTGNVDVKVTLTTSLSSGLSAGPPPEPVTVKAGQSVTVPLTITSDPTTPLNRAPSTRRDHLHPTARRPRRSRRR